MEKLLWLREQTLKKTNRKIIARILGQVPAITAVLWIGKTRWTKRRRGKRGRRTRPSRKTARKLRTRMQMSKRARRKETPRIAKGLCTT